MNEEQADFHGYKKKIVEVIRTKDRNRRLTRIVLYSATIC